MTGPTRVMTAPPTVSVPTAVPRVSARLATGPGASTTTPARMTSCLSPDADECDGGDVGQLCGVTSGSKCVNTDGSYYCKCPKTHLWDSNKMACVWWNICKKDNPCLNGGRCYNTRAKDVNSDFVCRCPYWWTGRVCGGVDPEAELLRNILVGVAVGLGVLCIVLLVIIILLCRQRSRREKKQKKTAFGTYDFGNTTPPTGKKDDSIPHPPLPPPEPAVEQSTHGENRLSRPLPSVTEGVPAWGDSPTSPRKGKPVLGSYDFGFTPKRSGNKREKSWGKNSHGGANDNSDSRSFNAYDYVNSL
ncbi:hypothetical protein ACOMHN_013938 [Nucella lapillus]